jgi:hypothetical protein
MFWQKSVDYLGGHTIPSEAYVYDLYSINVTFFLKLFIADGHDTYGVITNILCYCFILYKYFNRSLTNNSYKYCGM